MPLSTKPGGIGSASAHLTNLLISSSQGMGLCFLVALQLRQV
jgi:hypothetical protein